MKLQTIFSGFLSLCFIVLLGSVTQLVDANFTEKVASFEVEIEPVELIQWIRFDYKEFTPSVGDYFLVDVSNAVGYLINDGSRYYTDFPIMTGSLSTPTPYKEWVVLDKNIQRNRVTFSESGEFFRMYIDGKTRTSYGIHGYAYFNDEIEKGRKFLSLGCVLVADDVLDLLEESYILNNNSLRVSTREVIDIEMYFNSLLGIVND